MPLTEVPAAKYLTVIVLVSGYVVVLGDIFFASLMPTGQFGPIVDLDYMTKGFAQFQMDKDGKLNLLRLSLVDGQAYEFRRE